MLRIVGWYFVLELLLIVSGVVVTLWIRKRRLKLKNQRPPQNFVKTEETFFDPTTGIKQRVWFNPRTGERYYEPIKD